jgi:hypothetical protein
MNTFFYFHIWCVRFTQPQSLASVWLHPLFLAWKNNKPSNQIAYLSILLFFFNNRKIGQGSEEELKGRDLKAELEERERRHFQAKRSLTSSENNVQKSIEGNFKITHESFQRSKREELRTWERESESESESEREREGDMEEEKKRIESENWLWKDRLKQKNDQQND